MNPGRPASRPDPNAYLPWNHQEPLCEPPSSQVTPARKGQSYRFSLGGDMLSLSLRRSSRLDSRSFPLLADVNQGLRQGLGKVRDWLVHVLVLPRGAGLG